MEMLVTYILVLLIFWTWHYWIKKTIKMIFKNFLYEVTTRFVSRVQDKEKKEKFYLYYKSTCKFIDKFTLRETNEIIDCICRDVKNNNMEIHHKIIYDEELEKYSKIALATIIGCLMACTFKGTIAFLFHMCSPSILKSREDFTEKRESILEEFADTIPQKEITKKNPAYVFQSFGEAAHATSAY